jgi:hypothetical protein
MILAPILDDTRLPSLQDALWTPGKQNTIFSDHQG